MRHSAVLANAVRFACARRPDPAASRPCSRRSSQQPRGGPREAEIGADWKTPLPRPKARCRRARGDATERAGEYGFWAGPGGDFGKKAPCLSPSLVLRHHVCVRLANLPDPTKASVVAQSRHPYSGLRPRCSDGTGVRAAADEAWTTATGQSREETGDRRAAWTSAARWHETTTSSAQHSSGQGDQQPGGGGVKIRNLGGETVHLRQGDKFAPFNGHGLVQAHVTLVRPSHRRASPFVSPLLLPRFPHYFLKYMQYVSKAHCDLGTGPEGRSPENHRQKGQIGILCGH